VNNTILFGIPPLKVQNDYTVYAKNFGGPWSLFPLAAPMGVWEHAPQLHLCRRDFPCSFDAHVHNT